MKIPRWEVWDKIRVKDGKYMGVGGIIIGTRLCAVGCECLGQFDCFNTFFYQLWIQISQEKFLTHGQFYEIQDGR